MSFAVRPQVAPHLVDLLRLRAEHHPDRRAFAYLKNGEEETDVLTFSGLDRRARAIGAALQQAGASGERVLLLYPSGLEYVAAFFGCLYAGAVAVPVYPPKANRHMFRLRAIAEDTKPLVALTTSAIWAVIEPKLENESELKAVHWMVTDTIGDEWADKWQEPVLDGESLAFLQYTSGSTGRPKGVMVTHGNIMHNEKLIRRAIHGTEESVFVSWLPIYHDMGLIGNILQPVYLGSSCVLMSPVDFLQRPVRWLRAVSRYRAWVSGGPNFAYDLCVRKVTDEQKRELDLSHWKVAFNGAEPVRAETLMRFAEAFAACGFRKEALFPCYGLAEGTLFVTGGHLEEPPVIRDFDAAALERGEAVPVTGTEGNVRTLVGCGRVWEQKVAIVDPDTQEECPPGKVGEIWVQGPSVAKGYWNREEESERTFRARLASGEEGAWMRTGDLGFFLDGELFVTGRIKDLIVIRGRNFYPQDLEWTTERSHPAIRPGCSAAFSLDADGEERLVIVAELERSYRPRQKGTDGENGANILKEVTNAIRRQVAEEHELQVYAVRLIKTGTIPKTSSGKIQRRACKEAFVNNTLDVWGE